LFVIDLTTAIGSGCLGTGIRAKKKLSYSNIRQRSAQFLKTALEFSETQNPSDTSVATFYTPLSTSSNHKMPKRKLDELSAPPPRPRASDTRKMSIHGTRLTQMFENGVLMISRGLKTSRGFERQKLSRREKTAKQQKDDKALARLKEEIETLKVCSFYF
jgi:hypothetical protein